MSRELVGAAAKYTTRTAKTTAQNPAYGRQVTAWKFYRTPEVRSYANWIGNAMSSATLYAGRRLADNTIERAPDDHPAAAHVARIAGGPDGQSQHLREYGRHLAVPGEGWTVIRPRQDGGEDWHIVSVLEMSSKGGSLEATIDGEPVKIPANDPAATPDPMAPVAIRVWDPAPDNHLEADSPVLASLDELEELRLLSAAVRAITKSRLTGRGVLLVPKGTRFPTKAGAEGDAEDDLIDVFMEVAETAIREPDSAAATVPIILEVPAESIAAITHLTMQADFDELAIKLRQELITRFATAADIPAEFLLGMGDVNHWGAWELTSEAIRLGIEPKLGVVTHAYTTQWLQPLLEADKVPNATEWMVCGDTSLLRVRTNQPQTAIAVHAVGAISDAALRRETGFDESDAPDAAEIARRTATNPQREDTVPTTPNLPADETTTPPDLPASVTPDERLLAAADGLIWHALSRAGEKLRRTPACPRPRRAEANQVSAAALHTLLPVTRDQVTEWGLLDGALDRAPEIATRYGADADCLRASLEMYLRELLAAGVEYEYGHVPAAIGPCLLAAA
jgi:hypothetical protein